MMTSEKPDRPIKLPPALAKRIVALCNDPAPESFPRPSLGESLETTERRKAEDRYQRSRAERTWWRLKPKDRTAIGKAVVDHEPWRTVGSATLQYVCVDEIMRIVDVDQHRE